MEDLFIKQTHQTPEINFKVGGELFIKGVSIPENPYQFFSPTMEWLDAWKFELPKEIVLNLDFEYLNTASYRSVVEIIKRIVAMAVGNISFRVVWHFDASDEDAKELGEDIEFVVGKKFEYQPFNS